MFDDDVSTGKVLRSAIVVAFIILALVIGVGFASGKAQAVYNRTVGKDVQDSQTEVFNSSQSRVDAMADELSKLKFELAKEKDEIARRAIIVHIQEDFANFDKNKLANPDLKQFLDDVMSGNIK